MNDLIEFVDGFYWPKQGGKTCRDATMDRHDTPQRISKYCKNFGTVISAGGNVGYYVKEYAKLFNKVYTFEPEPVNFYCLNLNVTEINVIKFHGVLGNSTNKVGLSRHCEDSGAWTVADGNEYQMYRIDNLELNILDGIFLDVEGFELEVLNGGLKSINQYHPIITIEANEETDACRFLNSIDYNKIDEVNGDWIFKYNE